MDQENITENTIVCTIVCTVLNDHFSTSGFLKFYHTIFLYKSANAKYKFLSFTK